MKISDVSTGHTVALGVIITTGCKVALGVIIPTDCAVPEIVGTVAAAGRQLTRVISIKRKSGITTIILGRHFMLWKSIR